MPCDGCTLITQDVAALLKAPISWVRDRIRPSAWGRMPGYKPQSVRRNLRCSATHAFKGALTLTSFPDFAESYCPRICFLVTMTGRICPG
jgi:hypothetical protein